MDRAPLENVDAGVIEFGRCMRSRDRLVTSYDYMRQWLRLGALC